MSHMAVSESSYTSEKRRHETPQCWVSEEPQEQPHKRCSALSLYSEATGSEIYAVGMTSTSELCTGTLQRKHILVSSLLHPTDLPELSSPRNQDP